jgi:rhamnulokinase
MGKANRVYLAVDLGASSGRVLAGLFDGRKLLLEEVHRFENGGILANDRLYWDLLSLWQQIKNGLRSAAARYGRDVASIGVDTWGVDFGLLGERDELLGNPLHYRDRHTDGVMDDVLRNVARETVFEETGLQFLPFNTLYQLVAMQRADSPLLRNARRFLMMPDLFHWLLTGVKANEFTNATTTQLYNPRQKTWSQRLLHELQLPAEIFGEIVSPGTRLGGLRAQVAEETGLNGVQVVLPGTHDTASAVMAVPSTAAPSDQPDWCYLSSGTWSLMGAEVTSPVINALCRQRNFTNEGGVGGTVVDPGMPAHLEERWTRLSLGRFDSRSAASRAGTSPDRSRPSTISGTRRYAA